MTTGIILDFLTIHSIILLSRLTCRIEQKFTRAAHSYIHLATGADKVAVKNRCVIPTSFSTTTQTAFPYYETSLWKAV